MFKTTNTSHPSPTPALKDNGELSTIEAITELDEALEHLNRLTLALEYKASAKEVLAFDDYTKHMKDAENNIKNALSGLVAIASELTGEPYCISPVRAALAVALKRALRGEKF